MDGMASVAQLNVYPAPISFARKSDAGERRRDGRERNATLHRASELREEPNSDDEDENDGGVERERQERPRKPLPPPPPPRGKVGRATGCSIGVITLSVIAFS